MVLARILVVGKCDHGKPPLTSALLAVVGMVGILR
jgi:translation elongation factor EF-Tu-like GTPase